MRAQDWIFTLCFVAAGCSVIVDQKLNDKPSAIAEGDGDESNGDGDHPGDGDGDIGGDSSTGDGDGDMMAGDGDGLGQDGGVGYTRADIKLCLGASHGCRLFPNGKLACWGNNDELQTSLTDGTFKDVACGDYHTCALTTAGIVNCVGRNRDGQRMAPVGGSYKAVTAGDTHSCAIRADDTVECWGNNLDKQATPPATVAFSSISGGGGFTCGIRKSDSKIECWGSTSSNRLKPPTDAAFKTIDLGPNYGCGITTDGVVRCWGNTAFVEPDLSDAHAISMGTYHACAVKDDKTGTCWPPSPLPLAGSYLGVTSGPSGHLFTPETGEPQFVASDSFFPTPPPLFYESP